MSSFNNVGHSLRSGLSLLLAFWMAACAGMAVIEPDETAGAVVVMGMSVEGANVPGLGHYYGFRFSNEDGETQTLYKRPRELQSEILFTELAPGRWTLESFRALSLPDSLEFEPTSSRPRDVYLTFDVRQRSIQVLAYQLTIEHRREDGGIVTYPGIAALTDRVRERVERRVATLGEDWQRVPEPVGELEARDDSDKRGLLENLFDM